MKEILSAFAVLLWLTARLSAQGGGVTVELSLEQEQFLPNEDLRVAVRITNLSGQTLHLGEDADWLSFNVEAVDKSVVSKLGEVPVQGEFTLATTQAGTKRVNLTPYFGFRPQGRYQVTATVKIPQWQQAINSAPKRFDIINGTKLREIEFGVPLARGASGRPEVRKYVLQRATYLKQLKLYVRVTDASGARTFKVMALSPMVSFGEPETQLDQSANLHVLNQTGARAFNYCVINPEGEMLARQTHEFSSTRPRLALDDTGKISVQGGTQRPGSTDYPPVLQTNSIHVSEKTIAP